MPIGLKRATPFRSKSTPMKWKKKKKARDVAGEMRDDLSIDIEKFKDMPLTDEYATTQNAFAGFGQGNRILGMQNPYAGMGNPLAGMQTQFENKFEDMGVNTKGAELAQKQFQQSQASQLEAMKTMGMSGGQVQAMANASLQQAATTRADIGGQEQQAKMASAKGAEGVQRMEAEAKEKKMKAGFEVDKMIRKGQFDVDKLIGATELDIDKTQMEGDWKADMARRGGAADLQNLQLQKAQGALALQAGMLEGAQGEVASTKWHESDRKLKHNIVLVGKSPSGLSVYNFEYKDSKFGEGVWQGVMSDEIPSKAVIKHEDGYDVVDYSKIDVNFIKIKN